jgi:hypothetical protein
MRCDVVIDPRVLRLTRITTNIAGGTISGRATLPWDWTGDGEFVLTADRVSLEKIGAPWRESIPRVQGSVTGHLRGQLGSPWKGDGQFKVVRGNFAGVPLQSMRGPFDWAFAPDSGNARFRVRLTNARVASGRLGGDFDLRWAGRLSVDGKAKVSGADMKSLARAAPRLQNAMTGQLSGSVQFQGANIRSVDDLTGRFQGTLVQSQAMALPVLESLTTALGFTSASAETFTKSEIQGHFQKGIFTVQRMTMESPENRLFVEGTLTTRGNLDIDVTADTRKLAAVGLVLGVIRPLDFLRRRLIFLHIGGSLRSPVVQPRTTAFIEQEIQRYFLPFVFTE